MPQYPTTKLKTIKYNSPSGTININKWIPPFEKVKGGFGFTGVLAEDSKTGQLQCHVCGDWYELLTTHIFAKHNLTSLEYCERFGLLRSTALKSMRIRKLQSKVMLDMRKRNIKHRMKFKKGNLCSANRRGKPKAVEAQNRYGLCNLQVVDKITALKNKLGKTPALTEVIDEYGASMASLMHTRYAGYLKFIKEQGWTPVVSSRNPKYSKEYFIQLGVRALKSGKKLIGKRLMTVSESRNIYNYFASQGSWRKAVLKTANKLN